MVTVNATAQAQRSSDLGSVGHTDRKEQPLLAERRIGNFRWLLNDRRSPIVSHLELTNASGWVEDEFARKSEQHHLEPRSGLGIFFGNRDGLKLYRLRNLLTDLSPEVVRPPSV